MINPEIKEKIAYKQLVARKALAQEAEIIDRPILYIESNNNVILHHLDKGKSQLNVTQLSNYIETLNLINEDVQKFINEYSLSEKCDNLALELGYESFLDMWADEEFTNELNDDAYRARACIETTLELIKTL